MIYVCNVCKYEYNEEKGDAKSDIAPGTSWDNVPESYRCPLCKVGKEKFSPKA